MFSFIILFLFWLWLMSLPLFFGQMLLPIFWCGTCHVTILVMCGKWKNHLSVLNSYCLVDVIAIIWMPDVIANCGWWKAIKCGGRCCCHCGRLEWLHCWNVYYGRCYSQCGRWNSHWVNVLVVYFSLSSVMLFRTSSLMWEASVKALKTYVRSMAYKSTLVGTKQSKTSWWHLKVKIS